MLDIIGFPMPACAFVLKEPVTKAVKESYDDLIDELYQDLAMVMIRARFTPDVDRHVNFREEQKRNLQVILTLYQKL